MVRRARRDQAMSGGLSINVLARDNGGGLRTDLDVLTNLLGALGYQPAVNGSPTTRESKAGIISRLRGRLRYEYALFAGPFYDLNIFLEYINPRFIPQAHLNCLIPNPEWF